MLIRHQERHRTSRTGWLRAAVLGANDGIVSTASLILGVAAADAATSEVLLAGVAGLVAGASSMAAGEYVSVVATKYLYRYLGWRRLLSGNALTNKVFVERIAGHWV